MIWLQINESTEKSLPDLRKVIFKDKPHADRLKKCIDKGLKRWWRGECHAVDTELVNFWRWINAAVLAVLMKPFLAENSHWEKIHSEKSNMQVIPGWSRLTINSHCKILKFLRWLISYFPFTVTKFRKVKDIMQQIKSKV